MHSQSRDAFYFRREIELDIEATARDSEIIEVVQRQSSQSAWIPVEGEEIFRFRDRLKQLGISDEDQDRVISGAVAVLSRCLPPHLTAGRETGLIVGYVQSGKTMSFTAVAALARDNGYKLIIVITGITKNLFQQSTERLKKDLGIADRTDRQWQFLDNPKVRPDIKQRIEKAIRSSSSSLGIVDQTALITVMKNRTHLDHLIRLLRGLSLSSIPALIIDDEADQASLNNRVRKGDESATYRRIIELRSLLPHHTFLQYTATPQAPLLISIIDRLSPSFSEILTAGPAYTGGKVFFERDFRLIRTIPLSDVPTQNQPLTDSPESLQDAMRIFFLGVAAGLKSGGHGNRSMMVHPSKRVLQHANYFVWVTQAQQEWGRVLALDGKDPDLQDLVEEFETSYDDLKQTVQDLPSLELLLPWLQQAISGTIVTPVNSAQGPTPQVDWRQDYAHILVGGEVLNRGFTVEGLTVTYMPRGKGVGNADTIEQRARWFGYKADYLGYCRVYLDQNMEEIYRRYVNHEESMRDELRKFRAMGEPLSSWTRRFFLASDLRPTRTGVLDLEYGRGSYSSRWYEPRTAQDSPETIQINRLAVDEFLSALSLTEGQYHEQATDEQKYKWARVPLQVVYKNLLTKLKVTHSSELQAYTGLLLHIDRYLDQHPDEECTIYLMSQGKTRRRGLDSSGKIPHIFQGPTPAHKPYKMGELYPGDAQIRAEAGISIQIHNLNIARGEKIIAQNVPVVAVWMPRDVNADWLAGPGQPVTEDDDEYFRMTDD
jgi:hypothetical protein